MRLTIPFHVGEVEIANGHAVDAYACPVALALVRAGIQVPMVEGGGWVRTYTLGPVREGHGWHVYYGNTPADVVAFVKKFDGPDWQNVEPFSSTVTFTVD